MNYTEQILQNFRRLAAHPRPSGHEQAVAEDLVAWGREQGFDARHDAGFNVVIDVSATPGCENVPRTILQGHLDMVCTAAEGVAFDPLRDVPKIIREGNTLHADGTTLGADNGLGVGLAMAVCADRTLRHGPLRLLATTDEEGGAEPIGPLDPSALDGRFLINLDSETCGVLTNSCAGNQALTVTITGPQVPAPFPHAYRVALSGFAGGHSGADIHLDRVNPLIALAGLLDSLPALALADFSAGTAHNAIPTAASALVLVPDDTALRRAADSALAAWREKEPAAVVSVEPAPLPASSLSPEVSRRAAALIARLPNGVRTWAKGYDNLVESSCSADLARMADGVLTVTSLARSLRFETHAENEADFRTLCRRYGFELSVTEPGHGWPADPDNPLERLFAEVWREITGRDLVIRPIHAGLECASFAAVNPRLSLVSLGPTILYPHSPSEPAVLDGLEELAAAVGEVVSRISCMQ